MSITIQKSTSGAYFTVQRDALVPERYIVNDYNFQPANDGIRFSLVDKYRLVYIIELARYLDVINGDTGLTFASFSALETYILTNFFRKAGGGAGTLSASNFIPETPSGTINNSNTVFTLSFTPALVLGAWKNGALLAPTEYSVSTNQITYTVAPGTVPSNDILLILYIK